MNATPKPHSMRRRQSHRMDTERQVGLLILFRGVEDVSQWSFAHPGRLTDRGDTCGNRKAILERHDHNLVALNGERIQASAAFNDQEAIFSVRTDCVSQNEWAGRAQPGDAGRFAALHVYSIKIAWRVSVDILLDVRPERESVQAVALCRV